MTEEPLFTIHAPGVDTEAIVREIRETVARKAEEGVYNDPRIAAAERHNLAHMQDSGELLRFFLHCLQDTAHVDMADYAIKDRRGGFPGRLLVRFKTVIWKLLKFYTYRMWSQQNQVNGLMATAVESSFNHYERRIAELEARLAALEGSGRTESPPEA